MTENKGAIHVGHRRLLSTDRLCEQVYVLHGPIWPRYIIQTAISPVSYLSQWKRRVCVCVVFHGVAPGQAGPV